MSETTLQPAISTISRYGEMAKTIEIEHTRKLGKKLGQKGNPDMLLSSHADALLTTMKIGLTILGAIAGPNKQR